MNILIADKLESEAVAGLEALGCSVRLDPDLTPDSMGVALKASEAEVLIVRSTKVPAGALASSGTLRLVIRAGAGYDNIDCAAADEHGVAVCNCPGMNAIAVAELAIGHLINLDRRIGEQTNELRAGRWNKGEFAKARGLAGRKLLVIGTGAIGTAVIVRAKALGMEVWAQSRSLGDDTARALGIHPVPYTREAIVEALGRVDAVSIHVASTPDTKTLCGPGFFAAMKPGAYFINTSRGDIVDEDALIEAITTKGVRAGLDVYADQPADKKAAFKPALADLPGVSLTHHCGASTDQAQLAVAEEVVRIVAAYRESGRLEHLVNHPKPR